ncbi:MAG: 4Fe-4S dicluster domain-containing protein [Oscillospiraceae bacterium]|jgi:2-oxoglutarate ferredoxin oxidoreductase subunit delta|nr:4Fe-4S dicluster domain-containing protein [Oscillospiraceae bacterium]
MPQVTFDADRCKGCSLCVSVCPRKIIVLSEDTFNARGFHPAKITDPSVCIACAFCATMCPDAVIKVEK